MPSHSGFLLSFLVGGAKEFQQEQEPTPEAWRTSIEVFYSKMVPAHKRYVFVQ